MVFWAVDGSKGGLWVATNAGIEGKGSEVVNIDPSTLEATGGK
jgi:hypothetical protein